MTARTDKKEDFEAFDQLPRQVRRELRRCRADISASAIAKLLRDGTSVTEAIKIAHEVDRILCERHRKEVEKNAEKLP